MTAEYTTGTQLKEEAKELGGWAAFDMLFSATQNQAIGKVDWFDHNVISGGHFTDVNLFTVAALSGLARLAVSLGVSTKEGSQEWRTQRSIVTGIGAIESSILGSELINQVFHTNPAISIGIATVGSAIVWGTRLFGRTALY